MYMYARRILGLALLPLAVLGEGLGDPPKPERVDVTGSNIRRVDYEGPAPSPSKSSRPSP